MPQKTDRVLFFSLWLALSLNGSFAPPAQAQTPSAASLSSALESDERLVMPFKNLSSASDQVWLGESFAEALTAALARYPRLHLVERSQVQSLIQEQAFGQSAFGDADSAPQLGKMLGASLMLLGAYQVEGQRIQVSVRLVDVQSGAVRPGSALQLEGQLSQVLELQAELAQKLAQKLHLNTQRGEPEVTQLTKSAQAYEAYYRGQIVFRTLSDAHLTQAEDYFEAAIAADPQFTQAYTALSQLLAARAANSYFLPSARPDDLSRALDYAQKALATGKDPAAVYLALAEVYRAQRQPELDCLSQPDAG